MEGWASSGLATQHRLQQAGRRNPPALRARTPCAGLFTLALVAAAEERHLLAAALFAALLCLKHIFLYAAPAFFVFLLRRYCRGRAAVPRFLGLGALVASIFGAAFGPFVAAGQLPQVGCAALQGVGWPASGSAAGLCACSSAKHVCGLASACPRGAARRADPAPPSLPGQLLRRLFPFARGLCHAYWAPNVWALYAAADKVLSLALGRKGAAASMTGARGRGKGRGERQGRRRRQQADGGAAGACTCGRWAPPTIRFTHCIHSPAHPPTAGGLVGVAEFAVLPQVGSGTTALWTLAAMAPCLLRLW